MRGIVERARIEVVVGEERRERLEDLRRRYHRVDEESRAEVTVDREALEALGYAEPQDSHDAEP